ncbi:ABC transporter ATP-binding protein [Haloimpatiens sp. FM7330]|uniref:ABC transporter ATP-binding protein n=1 Tax=Haloimpatiens sp. FM7330 TaxID=3298610 RepID=UPI00362D9B6E
MSIVETKKLAVGYNNKVVIDNIELEIKKGEVICLLGPNGAGKSTILKTISGQLQSVKGNVYIYNEDIKKINQSNLAKKMSVVLTERVIPSLMTSFEFAAMGRYQYTGFFGKLSDEDVNIVNEILKLVNAENLANRYFEQLSDGEKQKILLARALCQEPEIIILDEPTSYLDIRHKFELLNILNKLSKEKGITVILSLHEVDMALKGCDTAVLVKDGKIMKKGCCEDIIKEDVIKKLYGLEFGNFSSLLGTLEIPSSIKKSRVFVISGEGKGIPIYRFLTKHQYEVCTGIIYENDIDYYIANILGVNIIKEKAFESIKEINFKKAVNCMKKCEKIIDAGSTFAELNKLNVDLIRNALEVGKKVYSFRDKDECKKLFKENYKKLIYCNSVKDVID